MPRFAMLGDISPTAWPGKTLLVTWMRCYCQTETGERMHSVCFFSVAVYSKFFCFVCRPLCDTLLVGMYTLYIVLGGKIKYIYYHVFVFSECKNYILKYFTTHWTKKGKNHYDDSVLHWAHQCSNGSYKCLFIWWFVCVIWKQNTILRLNNIVLNVKFNFAGEVRGFAHCVYVFLICV